MRAVKAADRHNTPLPSLILRILIFHGYLLAGTGSNVYNANLAAALAELGHEVHLVTQERHAADLGFVDAVGNWDTGGLKIETLRTPVRVTAYRPDIGKVLPVYVADRYEALEARLFSDLSDDQLESYIAANVAAVSDVIAAVRPDVALANHLVMGPVILARALEAPAIPYAVKIHGSALEYTVKADPTRFLPYAVEGLKSARGILVGSRHTAESLWTALDDSSIQARTRLGPPGVNVTTFAPRERDLATVGLARLQARLSGATGATIDTKQDQSSFARDPHEAAAALTRLDPSNDRLVSYVGKIIISKGVDLMLCAWPLVLEEVPTARLVIIGFGAYREGLERMLALLAAGDLAGVVDMAQQGRALEGGPSSPLEHLISFLARLESDERARERYLASARRLADRVVLTGRLEHEEMVDVLPLCEAQIVPSTFPEAFGMVAAEASACGVLPICAGHSGLAEVTQALASSVPEPARNWLSFPVDDYAVEAIASRLCAWLAAPQALREATREALVATARDRYSWHGVARGVLDAAQGHLDDLPAPRPLGLGTPPDRPVLG